MPARYGSGRCGRLVGEAVDSESGDELGDALAVPPSSAICAGISDAEVSLSWVIANAPDPIGSPPNGSWSSESTGKSPSRWTGAIGWVRACRKPPSGVSRVNRTWCGLTALTVTSDHEVADGPV